MAGKGKKIRQDATEIRLDGYRRALVNLNDALTVDPPMAIDTPETEMVDDLKWAFDQIVATDMPRLEADTIAVLETVVGRKLFPEMQEVAAKKAEVLRQSKERPVDADELRDSPKPVMRPRGRPKGTHGARYSRPDSVIEALKIGGTRTEIILKANEFYVARGGEDNVVVSGSIFAHVYPILDRLNLVRSDVGGNTLKLRNFTFTD